MFPTGHGRHGKGTQYHAFNLAANCWQLHYLRFFLSSDKKSVDDICYNYPFNLFRLTNQLGDNNMEMVREIFKKMNEEYTGVMRRFNSRGAVSMWDRSKPSVWLTAWTLQIFRDVAFQVQKS